MAAGGGVGMPSIVEPHSGQGSVLGMLARASWAAIGMLWPRL